MKYPIAYLAIGLAIISPTILYANPSDSLVVYNYNPNPLSVTVPNDPLFGVKSAGGNARAGKDGPASPSNPLPPGMYPNSPPGPADEFDCIEEENGNAAGVLPSLPSPTGVYESPVGGVSGGSCAPAITVKKTLVVTSTQVVSSTCTVTTTKNIPVVTTITQHVTQHSTKTVNVTVTATSVVDRVVTQTQAVTVTVSTCDAQPTGSSPINSPPDSPSHPGISPEQSECVEYETIVPGGGASSPIMTQPAMHPPMHPGGGYSY